MKSSKEAGTKIFISYRRSDSEGVAGRLFDRLSVHFGAERIFMDVDTIAPGEDFVEAIESADAHCDVLIAVIGPDWLEARDQDDRRRVESPEDFVRVEIAAALERDVLVVPVLVGGATMPRSSELPESLRKLARRNALELDHARWRHDSLRLIEAIEQRVAARSSTVELVPSETLNAPATEDGKPPGASPSGTTHLDVGQRRPAIDTSNSVKANANDPDGYAHREDFDLQRQPPVQDPVLNISAPLVSRPVNLGLDGPVEIGFPHGWFNGENFVSNVSTSYKARVVPRPEGHGACVVYENMLATSDEFGVVMQRCPAPFLAGKVVRLQAELATSDVEQWAGLWLRADGKENPNIFFDNMERNPVRGTTSWARYALDGQLPQESVWLNYGLVIVGPGRVSADNFRLLVWSGGQWEDI